MPIRFHLDEHVPPAVAYGLRQHGVDATTSQNAALLGRRDEDQLSFAIAEQRVLVTHDQDFTTIHAEGAEHFGICFCHLRKYPVGELLRMLLIVSECLSEADMRNHIEFI